MGRPRVKICGLQRLEDVEMCTRLGADVLGFIVDYPQPVPWNLTAAEAKALMAAVPLPVETCVVTGGTVEQVYAIGAALRPSYIQLHWESSPADSGQLAERLGQLGVKLIQTIFPHTTDLEQTAAVFCRAGVFALLLDPRRPEQAAQGGEADIALWRKIQGAVSCPVILAGGIGPQNAGDFARESGVWMIDLLRGVEQTSGVKDEALVEALFLALRDAVGN